MDHPEILILPVLMLADYYLTLVAARGMGQDPARRAAYELNPRFKRDVAEGRRFSWIHLANVALATGMLWLLARLGEPAFYRFALGLVIGAWGVLSGTHLGNIALTYWLRRTPGAVQGKITTDARFHTMNSTLLTVGLAVLPLAIVAAFEPAPLVLGAATGALLVALAPQLYARQAAARGTRIDGGGALLCSFCGRSEAELTYMLAADRANICEECVETCREALAEEKAKEIAAEKSVLGR